MKKLILLIFFLSILLVNFSYAEDDEDLNFSSARAYEWLAEQNTNGFYQDLPSTAMAALAFDNLIETNDLTELSIEWLHKNQAVQGCWPSTNCQVRDTAFGLYALSELGEDFGESEEWLKSAQSPALTSGKWYLQLATSSSGVCTVYYGEDENSTKSKEIEIIEGNITDPCAFNAWLDINDCFESGLLNKNPTLSINVDCEMGMQNINILYNAGNEYYIVDGESSSSAELFINNGCFGSKPKSSCDYMSTLYANLALNSIDSDINSLFYLRNNYVSSDILHNALLSIILEGNEDYSQKYQDKLLDLQKTDGSWDRNFYKTAWAMYALRDSQPSEAEEWLKQRQHERGHWGNSVLDTATILYSVFTDADDYVGVPSCYDGICNQDEDCLNDSSLPADCGGVCEECGSLVCDYDGVCEEDQGEDEWNCPDCDYTEECIFLDPCEIDGCPGICNEYGYCEKDDPECGLNEPDCGNGNCDYWESEETCPEDCSETPIEDECFSDLDCDTDSGEICLGGQCILDTVEEEGGFPWVTIIILLILLIGGFAFYYFYFLKKKGGKNGGTSGGLKLKPFNPNFPTKGKFNPVGNKSLPAPKFSSSNKKLEADLEKSLSEARKLLGKK